MWVYASIFELHNGTNENRKKEYENNTSMLQQRLSIKQLLTYMCFKVNFTFYKYFRDVKEVWWMARKQWIGVEEDRTTTLEFLNQW